jgi:hypothetical protein
MSPTSPAPAAAPRRPRRWHRPLLIASALAAAFLVTIDAASYAATGASLVLGRVNAASTPTTVANEGAGPVLRLQTSSTASAPFTTNATGKVANLHADKLDGLDAAAIVSAARAAVDASRLQGRTAAQVADLAPVPRFTFARDSIRQTSNPGWLPGALSSSGATPGTYRLTGTLTIPCAPGSTSGYLFALAVARSALDVDPVILQRSVPASRCGQPLPLDQVVTMTADSKLLLRVHDIDAGDLVQQPLAFDLRGVPVQARL